MSHPVAAARRFADTAAGLFYGRLFELDPAVERLFRRTDMAAQRKVLMQTLAVVVKSLDRLDQIVPAVQALGRRHAGYGVREAHYATVGAALLWTLEQGLGSGFTPAVREAWATAYGILASEMIDATNAEITAPRRRRSSGRHDGGFAPANGPDLTKLNYVGIVRSWPRPSTSTTPRHISRD